MGKLNKILAVPDAHHPYHDKRAWNLLLDIGAEWKPDILVEGGDLVDFANASVYLKDPRQTVPLDEEIQAGNKAVDDLTSLGAKRNCYLEGNHEIRIQKRILEKLPELIGQFPSAYEMLQMHRRRKWEWIPYMDYVTIGKLSFTHDIGHAGKSALDMSASAFGHNLVFFHTHRAGIRYWGNVHEGSRVCVNSGWLGDRTKIHYTHKARTKDWQLGFTTIYQDQSGLSWCAFNPILDTGNNKLKCIFEGKEYVK